MSTPLKSVPPREGGPRESPLDLSPEQFRAIGHRLIDDIAAALERIPAGPVTPGEPPASVREAFGLGRALPESGEDPATFVPEVARQLFAHSLFNAHPRFFGYITSSPAPIGMLGDLLAAAANPNCGSWTLSPAGSEIESEVVRWIAQLIGYPSDASGVLVSGGNMANLVCFWAARTARAPWSVRTGGLTADARRLRVYASAETHTWIQKAADLGGLGTDAIRWIPVDRELRMDVAALRRALESDRAAGDVPMMVVGTGGSVSTGAIDPLDAIADACRDHGAWFHVDGAYGGFAAASSEAPPELRALARADSVAIDPHKWLYAPLEAGCALVRDEAAHRAAFSYHPPYYHFDEKVRNFVDFGPQNSRGFRALKVWFALRQAGAAGYRTLIDDDIRLSHRMADAVRRHPELEFATQALSITTFRYVPADLRARVGDPGVEAHLDGLNRELLDRLQRGGEVFVSNAVREGRYLLRACIVNFRTQTADVDAVPEIVVRLGRTIDAEQRPADLRS